MRLSAIDLFCGAGGLTAGLTRAGFEVIGAVDAWDKAVESYRRNFPHRVLCTDVSGLSWADLRERLQIGGRRVDLVAGGPPCQGFSIQRIGADEDDRNSLIQEFARLVCECRPSMFLMENVPGLVGKRGRHVVAAFEARMAEAGYGLCAVTANAAEYGVPQVRKRVFYCGWLTDRLPPFRFPEATHPAHAFRTVWEAIGDLPSPPLDCSPLPGDPLHRRMRLSPTNLERLRFIPPGKGFEALPVELRVDCHKNGADRIGHRYVYGRLEPHAPAGTITARFDSFTRGKFAHPFEDRNITLREGARLQTFDDAHVFVGTQEEIAAQIGNAIPPMLAGVLGAALLRHLIGGAHHDSQGSSNGEALLTSSQLRLPIFDLAGR